MRLSEITEEQDKEDPVEAMFDRRSNKERRKEKRPSKDRRSMFSRFINPDKKAVVPR